MKNLESAVCWLMRSRSKISVVLMLAYLFAMALNAFVTLTCDCASCHHHSTHSCKCESCVLLEQNPSISQHCECTHSHEAPVEIALAVDGEKISKSVKIVVVELSRAFAESLDNISIFACESPTAPLSVPLDDAPLLSLGGLRAPPVVA